MFTFLICVNNLQSFQFGRGRIRLAPHLPLMKALCSLILLSLIIGVIACSQEAPPSYLPSQARLRSGIYNKYYLHYQPADRSDWDTDIAFLGYQSNNDQGQISLTTYSPALEVTRVANLAIDRDSWQLLSEEHYFQTGDTSIAQVEGGTLFQLSADSTAPTTIQIDYPYDVVYIEQREHLSPRDTIIDNRKGRILPSKGYRRIERTDTTIQFDFQREEVLVEGIGLYSRSFNSTEFNYQWELMEQLPATEFRRLLADVPKRVGYINPQEALEGPGTFSTCGSEDEIYDYYNGDPDGQPMGGKPALWQVVENHWEPDLFEGLSGYLSLHFIINCEGEIGRFGVEQTNLDFQPTTFSNEAIRHCMDLLLQVPSWQPTVLREEPTDSYAYITFKLENGALIDIIP